MGGSSHNTNVGTAKSTPCATSKTNNDYYSKYELNGLKKGKSLNNQGVTLETHCNTSSSASPPKQTRTGIATHGAQSTNMNNSMGQ